MNKTNTSVFCLQPLRSMFQLAISFLLILTLGIPTTAALADDPVNYEDAAREIDTQELLEAMEATHDEIDGLEARMLDLFYTAEDAINYGEEPYLSDSDGGYMSGNETVEMCLDSIWESYQDWNDFNDQLDVLYELWDEANWDGSYYVSM